MKMLDKKQYRIGEKLLLHYNTSQSTNTNSEVVIQVIHIYDYYDEVITINTTGKIENNEFSASLEYIFDKGLYAIKFVSVNGEYIFGNNSFDPISFDYFTVELKTEKTDFESIYKEIVQRRENEINQVKVLDSKEGNSLFDVYVFVKNIKIKNRLQYGDIEVIPFISIQNESERKVINSFFETNKLYLNLDNLISSNSRPTAVFCLKNVYANNNDQLMNFAIPKTQLLIDSFTMLTKANAEIFAVASLNIIECSSCVNVLNPIYTGDLLLLADQSFTVRHYYEKLSEDPSFAFFLKLLNEAEKETNRMYKYYKLWTILEAMASAKNYSNHEMRKWNGEIVTKRNGDNCLIGEEALNNVFELFRNHFSDREETDLFTVGTVDKAKSFLSICYQRRCCCVHHGSCFMNDPKICLSDKANMCRCKENNYTDTLFQSKYDDSILIKLESFVYEIFHKELDLKFGCCVKSTEQVESLLMAL